MFEFLFKRRNAEATVADDDSQVLELFINKCELESACTISETSQLNVVQLDSEIRSDDQQENARLIARVLELRKTLGDMYNKLRSIKQHNDRLKDENRVLNKQMTDLTEASSVLYPLKKTSNGNKSSIYYWN